jgi:hypothetical protein|nr:MAG TPA: hypothetical protein [Caudoviricetes sp.]
MVQLTDEQKNDDLVKSLLGSGFTEEVIAGWIESGSIKLEKSVQSGPDDHGEGDGDGNHEKKEKDKDKKEGEGDDDSDLEKGNGCGDGDKKKDDISKSLSADIIKSIEDGLLGKFNQSQDDLLKSIPAIVEKALEPVTDKIEKSLDGMRQAIIAFGNSAPEFKSAGLSKAIIEKSIEQGGGAKDEDNKTVLSISRDRAVVRELIAKSIDEEADPEIQKSLRDNTTAYLLDPIGGDIGKDAALYMYNKKNVRLVK